MVTKISSSLDNIQIGTHAFNQNMEALKYNFLCRRYFRILERQKQKEARKTMAFKEQRPAPADK